MDLNIGAGDCSDCGGCQNFHQGLGFSWGGSQDMIPSAFSTSISRNAARVMSFLAARVPMRTLT